MSDYAVGEKDHLQIIEREFVKILEKRHGPLEYSEINSRKSVLPIGYCDTSVPLIGGFDTSADVDAIKPSELAAPTYFDPEASWRAFAPSTGISLAPKDYSY
jgi:hypothetical protein